MCKVPVLFIIFNRPEIAKSCFEAIREYKPTELYIAADGPRDSRVGERELCELTRKTIPDMIDWECNVHTLFRDENIGVDFGVYNAINWMFETEPWGVIIEDDCFVSQDFFELCEDAFPRFNHEPRVAHIIANNPMSKIRQSSNVYYTYHAANWGWGTWGKKWYAYMDVEMRGYSNIKTLRFFIKYGFLQGLMYLRDFSKAYKRRATLHTWDTLWHYSIVKNDLLCLLPAVNLAKNNGIGTCEGTHYGIGETDYYEGVEIGRLVRPYIYPSKMNITFSVRASEWVELLSLRYFGLKKKLKNFFNENS